MPPDKDPNILPSIFTRLIDDQPTVSREPIPNRKQTLRELEKAVAEDLEALLNTRQETLEDLPPEFAEVNRSLVTYGLPDFTSFSLQSRDDCNRIRRAVEEAINTFEPRLKRARVTLEAPRDCDRGLRFRIDAVLHVEPVPEPVMFDAVLQLNTQQYIVQGQS